MLRYLRVTHQLIQSWSQRAIDSATVPQAVARLAASGRGWGGSIVAPRMYGRAVAPQPWTARKPTTLPITGFAFDHDLPEADIKPWPFIIRVPIILALSVITWMPILFAAHYLYAKY